MSTPKLLHSSSYCALFLGCCLSLNLFLSLNLSVIGVPSGFSCESVSKSVNLRYLDMHAMMSRVKNNVSHLEQCEPFRV